MPVEMALVLMVLVDYLSVWPEVMLKALTMVYIVYCEGLFRNYVGLVLKVAL